VVVRFVDIGRIIDRDCLSFLLIRQKVIGKKTKTWKLTS